MLVKPFSRDQSSFPGFPVGPSFTVGFCVQLPSCGNKERCTTLGKSPTDQQGSPTCDRRFSLVLCALDLDFEVKLPCSFSRAQLFTLNLRGSSGALPGRPLLLPEGETPPPQLTSTRCCQEFPPRYFSVSNRLLFTLEQAESPPDWWLVRITLL